jgi:natural product biosynthesis luciferase-like monooxygenase protein
MKFGILFFSGNGSTREPDKYRLLLEAAKFADERRFTAIWTPERHFSEFGGLYPNPSVTSAAIAAITQNIGIRAGSVILPLHSTLRVAEEWSVVDNLSNGRVGIAVGCGWNANDFVLSPNNFKDARNVMYRRVDILQKLWRGESITIKNGSGQDVPVSIYPRPIQPRLPIWISGQSQSSFVRAGSIGANVLTHLVLRDLPELEQNIRAYRQSLADHGYDPANGQVALMMHTFLDSNVDRARSRVQAAYSSYVGGYLDFLGSYWRTSGIEGELSQPERALLLNNAFDRLLNGHGLVGSPDACVERITKLRSIGVTEIACLIDFGIDTEIVLEALNKIDELKAVCS